MVDNLERINNFINTLSTERFDRYLALASGDKEYALKLYDANALLSEALYIPLQALEVTLRNSMHTRLKQEFNEYWFDSPEVIRVKYQYEQVGESKASLVHEKKEIIPGRVVAALPFGFWTSMFKPEYDELWKKHMYKIVSEENRKGITRKSFSGPLEPIRKLIRNRIAHHECILNLDLKNHYQKIKFLIGLLSPEAKFWMENNSKFESLYKEQEKILAPLFEEQKHETGTK